jgi:hypothetical protein
MVQTKPVDLNRLGIVLRDNCLYDQGIWEESGTFPQMPNRYDTDGRNTPLHSVFILWTLRIEKNKYTSLH